MLEWLFNRAEKEADSYLSDLLEIGFKPAFERVEEVLS